ncbi:auxin-binding protein T92-like, partial [Olea europaea var. sylvestris]|uniref:auxin-binding protein T92-like n=1 Tax=Olea europaea var. sylvestris TaxID=158386 RepID=UPI000C1CF1ED
MKSLWEANSIKYPTLQNVARDLLAIPISTVTSESTFSSTENSTPSSYSRACIIFSKKEADEEFLISVLPSATGEASYSSKGVPIVRNTSELAQDNYGRLGLSHITIVGSLWIELYSPREVEVWLKTFSPGAHTPIRGHSCEEFFLVLKGSGTPYLASNTH